MTQSVTLPDGSIHNFPDEATPQMISSALNVKPPLDQNFAQNFGAGAIQNLEKTGSGLLGLGTDALQDMGIFSPQDASAYKSELSKVNQGAEQQFPANPGIGHFLGANTVGNPMAFLPGLDASGAGAMGGLMGSVAETDPNASLGMKASNAVVGTGVGAATGKVLQGILGKASSSLSPEEQRLASIASDNGIQLTPAQQTGSKPLNLFEQMIGNQDAQAPKQAGQFTKAVLSKAGIDSDVATPDVIEKAYSKIGGTIGDITKGQDVPVDNQLYQDVMKVQNEYGKQIPALEKPQFENFASDITKDPSITGETYQNTRSLLGRISRTANNSNPVYADAISGLQSALDDAMERNLTPEKAAQLSEARGQYGNLKTIMKSMKSGTDNALSGNIPPNRFLSSVVQNNPTGYVTGKGPLNDLARTGNRFVEDSSNSNLSDIMKGAARSLVPAGLAGGAEYTLGDHDPEKALEYGALALTAPALARLLYRGISPVIMNGIPGLNNPAMIKGASGAAGSYLSNLISAQSSR